jgi:hypothetical protein
MPLLLITWISASLIVAVRWTFDKKSNIYAKAVATQKSAEASGVRRTGRSALLYDDGVSGQCVARHGLLGCATTTVSLGKSQASIPLRIDDDVTCCFLSGNGGRRACHRPTATINP